MWAASLVLSDDRAEWPVEDSPRAKYIATPNRVGMAQIEKKKKRTFPYEGLLNSVQ